MRNKVLIVVNLCLVGVLLFILTNFYILDNENDFEQSRQYTLLLKQYETEHSVEETSNEQEASSATDEIIKNIDSIIEQERRVSFLISELGINTQLTSQVITTFPKEVSLGFSAYSKDLARLMEEADENDVLLNLPVNKGILDTSTALDNEVTDEENLKRLSLILSQGDGDYVGVYTENNESFLFSNNIIYELMQALAERHKLLCYGSLDKITMYLARENHVGFITPDLVIEYNFDNSTIKEKLELISIMHKYQKDVLVIVKPSPVAIETLSEFIKQKNDFTLVRITDMVQ